MNPRFSKSKRRLIIFATIIVLFVVGAAAYMLWQRGEITKQDEQKAEVIKRTDVADYTELSKKDLNDRSEVLFGKPVDELTANDTKANAYEVAKLLAANKKTTESIVAFKNADSQVRGADRTDYYNDYKQALDAAGRHDEANELIRRQIAELEKVSPPDEIAISRLRSQLEARQEYYK